MKILVSACLFGLNCRYCGGGCINEKIISLASAHDLIPVCPEQLGGLPTPREPDEILNGRVIEKNGKDNTLQFKKGAEETLKLAGLLGCSTAVLKENSPSCGSSFVYDGHFSGTKIHGSGITASLLIKNGINVINETEAERLLIKKNEKE